MTKLSGNQLNCIVDQYPFLPIVNLKINNLDEKSSRILSVNFKDFN